MLKAGSKVDRRLFHQRSIFGAFPPFPWKLAATWSFLKKDSVMKGVIRRFMLTTNYASRVPGACAIKGPIVLLVLFAATLHAAVWQWSVPDGDARAYLWIPENCSHVRGLVVANHNMVEQGILEHPAMRETLTRLGFAELWVVPYLDATFDFNTGAGEHFEHVVNTLADTSGYAELRNAPVVPIGHSACATYPWNFAAWNPSRTLALISYQGDAPRTTLTGNGRPRVEWGNRSFPGVPALMVMSQYEWWEDRLAPAFPFMAEHPDHPIAFLASTGHGHFDCPDRNVAFLAKFIEKAAQRRLPSVEMADGPVPLRKIDPHEGWRVDRWHIDGPPIAPPAKYDRYEGDKDHAFWCFDEEMARETESIHEGQRGKLPQLIGVAAKTDPANLQCGEPVEPAFVPMEDGITFQLHADFLDDVPSNNPKATLWTGLPAGSSLGHATGGGPIVFNRIVGPFIQTGPDTFQLRFGRAEYTEHRRNNDMWIVASHPGDDRYCGIVQQTKVHAAPNVAGSPQSLTFPQIPDMPAGTVELKLNASSSSGLPVAYYVREGPAEIDGDTLRFTALPPRCRFPVAVTIVTWQFGHAHEPAVQSAPRVERTFFLTGPAKH